MQKEDYSEQSLEVLFISENSRKLMQALSNANSIKILKLLETRDLSAGELAEKLGLGLSTLKYNLDSLIAVGMIRVSEVKWSQRGRKIKIYEPVEKIIVLVPGSRDASRGSVLELLLRCKEEDFCFGRD
ncbi:ArsR family transcriptional regulator [Methanosarcina sp. 2.H.T.1A.6]|uniref:ArsR/SmtB family transcription factor n=1 Tax=unclassified Methanosarcina TaxID=2644672 RepID=UPI00062201FB|nr:MULTISPECIES: winged helix-turn-helix domain-containing protein [unclassified Methanosarcina]KKG14538.1 ArsR family transcriptional regulator [Methanosarcina sp. 2.H.T.1A.3]KKG23295.1 ArsR family transcriptional regulator [Methanosarcina sp. 2.H.T.1A.15]KKG24210.1 ArsR family transcriptional regulator [Methanosarcina sp. 2.H.T.1A.8]KKG24977.1 ArsR family transcriptional regulator [Methanosarcina sp. 2.H.T.1A.6]KKI00393.1 ArsR family transcriptional regulator [Methanosarcina sp. 1.H.T.1A.1]